MSDPAPTNDAQSDPSPAMFSLSTAVFVERAGEILILKRAAGIMTGSWYLPGGAVDPGETVEEGARRELLEEAGLVPDGSLTCVGVAHMGADGGESLQVLYACECATGDVAISHEYSGARWIEAAVYRERYFSNAALAPMESHARAIEMLRNIRDAIDAYLEWRRIRILASQV